RTRATRSGACAARSVAAAAISRTRRAATTFRLNGRGIPGRIEAAPVEGLLGGCETAVAGRQLLRNTRQQPDPGRIGRSVGLIRELTGDAGEGFGTWAALQPLR